MMGNLLRQPLAVAFQLVVGSFLLGREGNSWNRQDMPGCEVCSQLSPLPVDLQERACMAQHGACQRRCRKEQPEHVCAVCSTRLTIALQPLFDRSADASVNDGLLDELPE